MRLDYDFFQSFKNGGGAGVLYTLCNCKMFVEGHFMKKGLNNSKMGGFITTFLAVI